MARPVASSVSVRPPIPSRGRPRVPRRVTGDPPRAVHSVPQGHKVRAHGTGRGRRAIPRTNLRRFVLLPFELLWIASGQLWRETDRLYGPRTADSRKMYITGIIKQGGTKWQRPGRYGAGMAERWAGCFVC